ncbi:MAG TPA: hypothetical protein DCS93_10380 [Microscillaceae bacterium]|nr:hypothetical protein [Microscillaceae bacterium]
MSSSIRIKIITQILLSVVCLACTQEELKKQDLAFMQGETFGLRDTSAKKFLHKPAQIRQVYSYDKNGKKNLHNVTDFKVDYLNGTIRRTEKSSIPDYNNHKVVYNADGTFTFQSSPRNPELNVCHQVFVDYKYVKPVFKVQSQIKFLSDQFKQKLNTNDTVKILLIGDSIGGGAQTISDYFNSPVDTSTFLYYLKHQLFHLYPSQIVTINLSVGGEGAVLFGDNADKIVRMNPDVVIVEFGINDHMLGQSFSGVFENSFEYGIDKLKQAQIDIVLVGFFQQNKDWDIERPEFTRSYNQILQDLAQKHNLYFADIYQAFNKITSKDINEDLMADYIHHPNDFGHKIYYSCIIPAFLMQDTYCDKLDNFVSVPD